MSDVPETGGCTGECCGGFTLSQRTQLDIMNGTDVESAVLRDMLIPLGEGEFTCRWWINKRCLIHSDRPTMCRDFPAKGNPCGHDGCTEPNH